uniref:ATP-binding cassette domain-containing protein n=1 Tax=Gemmiger formicilis TaxID=745368 RepID=UPI0040275DC6
MQTVIETKALCKQYGPHTAVDHVELHVPQGCVYGFIGPNGAGKSTTMKMLLGLIHPTAGRVRLLGQELTEKSRLPLLRQTGSLIESPAGYLHLTAQENLEIVADLKGVPHKDIGRVLDIVHLTQDRNRRVGQYSLGMKQRLGIAMALLGSPKLLILDEPTNGLDPAGIQEMRALIRNMPAATGATVLISSHLLGEMEQMVEQVGIIDHGHILFEGPLTELQRHSRGDVTLRLLDPAKAAPILRANGLTAHGDSCVVTLPPLRDSLLADLVQKLAACGAGVVELTPHTKTLEEIFLSLTSEEAD